MVSNAIGSIYAEEKWTENGQSQTEKNVSSLTFYDFYLLRSYCVFIACHDCFTLGQV